MNTGILLGLAAAFCWGTADFCARGATRAAGTFLTLFYVQVIAVGAMLLVALPLGIVRFHSSDPGSIALSVALNLAILGGAALLYRAFAIGTLALASPIAASFAAITALLAITVGGEHPGIAQFAGILLTLVGVILASTVSSPATAVRQAEHELAKHQPPRQHRLAPGLLEALGAMLVFGVAYWALRFPITALGGIPNVFIGKVSDLVVLGSIGGVATARAARRHTPGAAFALRLPERRFWLFVVPTALLDTTANVAYNIGITGGLIAVVSVLSSLFSAVTVVLAWVFLRERLARWQWLGVGGILLGIALVSV